MYQIGTNLEVKWQSSSFPPSWVLPGHPSYGTALPFTQKGQAYGLYSGGFLHDSSPAAYGNFFLIDQTWPGANTLSYTPDSSLNDCTGGYAIPKVAAMGASITPSQATVSATVNTPITPITFTATGLSSDDTYVVTPALPTGLSLDDTTGTISGTPTAPSPTTAYTVTATDDTATASAVVTITVNPPSITPSTSSVSATVGTPITPVTFTKVGFTSDDTYSITPTLPAGLALDDSTGTISGTPTDDSASTVYTVTATEGAVSASANITIAVSPGAPSAPTITSVTPGDGSATINFTPPSNDGGATITNYEYWDDSSSTWTALSPASTTSPITITGLTNGTTYQVKLRALNGSASPGADSAAVSVTPSATPPPPVPNEPPSAPRDVVVTPGDGSVTVSWQPPASQGSFPITNYRVVSSPGGHSCLAIAPETTCVVPGLTNGQTYTFTVQALNGAGWGERSAPSDPVTPAAVITVPGPVRDLEVVRVSASGTVVLRWRYPASDGGAPVTSYRVGMRMAGQPDYTRVRPNTTTMGITITGLTPGARYWIRVRAGNEVGFGPGTRTDRIRIPRS